MAFIHAWGGNPNNTSGFVVGATLLEQHGIAAPTGNGDLDGSRPIRIYGVDVDYVSGGSGVSYAISYQGTLVGNSPITFQNSGGVFTFRVYSGGGTLYYGRNTDYNWVINANGSALGQTGALCGQFTWDTVPTAVRNLALSVNGTSATVTFTGPSSNGGAAIADYVVAYTRYPPNGPWSGWINAVSNVDGSHTFTNLNNGWRYAFSVYPRNAAGSGPRVQSATITIGGGTTGQIYDAGAWVAADALIYDNGAWVPAAGEIYDNGSWTPVS